MVELETIWERYRILRLLINDFRRDLRKALRLLGQKDRWAREVNRQVYSPWTRLYAPWKVKEEQARLNARLRDWLGWFAVLVFGAVAIVILWIDGRW